MCVNWPVHNYNGSLYFEALCLNTYMIHFTVMSFLDMRFDLCIQLSPKCLAGQADF